MEEGVGGDESLIEGAAQSVGDQAGVHGGGDFPAEDGAGKEVENDDDQDSSAAA